MLDAFLLPPLWDGLLRLLLLEAAGLDAFFASTTGSSSSGVKNVAFLRFRLLHSNYHSFIHKEYKTPTVYLGSNSKQQSTQSKTKPRYKYVLIAWSIYRLNFMCINPFISVRWPVVEPYRVLFMSLSSVLHNARIDHIFAIRHNHSFTFKQSHYVSLYPLTLRMHVIQRNGTDYGLKIKIKGAFFLYVSKTTFMTQMSIMARWNKQKFQLKFFSIFWFMPCVCRSME